MHPCRANEVKENNFEEYTEKMEKMFGKYKDKVVAVGECGLDYDRL